MRIFIDAGHYLRDSGAVSGTLRENQRTMELRDVIKALLPGAFFVPDDLNLPQSIAWVNAKNPDASDIAIALHFNSSTDSRAHGTEAYFSDYRRPELAILFSSVVSESCGFLNRGSKHDSVTAAKSLGWLRQIKCRSVLVELCFITNRDDMARYDKNKVAQGIVAAIGQLNPVPAPTTTPLPVETRPDDLPGLLALLRWILDQLKSKYNLGSMANENIIEYPEWYQSTAGPGLSQTLINLTGTLIPVINLVLASYNINFIPDQFNAVVSALVFIVFAVRTGIAHIKAKMRLTNQVQDLQGKLGAMEAQFGRLEDAPSSQK